MNTEDPSPSALQAALLAQYPNAILHADGYVAIALEDREIAYWIDTFGGTVRLRTVLVPYSELKAISNEKIERLSVHLNATYQFGRFNCNNPIGLILDYELPFIAQLPIEAMVSATEKLNATATAARENHIQAALSRARK